MKMKTFICTQIKNEQRYLKEWIDYHFNIGIDEIYLFEDYGSKDHSEIVRDYQNVHLATLHDYGIKDYHNTTNQQKLISTFLKECKKNNLCDWLAFIDVDEFITFDQGYDLNKIEDEYNDVSALLMSWKNYGANGYIDRPEGSLIKNYTKPGVVAESDLKWAKKSLINISKCDGIKNIHIAKGAVDVNRNPNESIDLVYEKIWIRHYFTKSWEDFKERIFERGNMSNNFRTLDNFFKCNPDMEYLHKELIYKERFRHTKNTMYLSRQYRLISGGNLNTIKQLENRLRYE